MNPENLKQKSTKGIIIQILSNKHSLTAKEIHHLLIKEHAKQISYQATHKTLKEMEEEGILEKVENKFKISTNWIKNLSTYAKNLESSSKENNGEVKTHTFSSITDAGKFLINKFIGSWNTPNPENKDSICIWTHAWPLTGVSQEEHENMKKMMQETKHINFCKNQTYLDKLTLEYLEKIGKTIYYSKKLPAKQDTFIEGDYILQFYYSKELEEEMDKLYTEVKNEKDLNMQKLFEFTTKPHKIKAIIFKNQELADSLREEAKKIVEEGK